MDLSDNIWKSVLFFGVLIVLFQSTDCQDFDSIVFNALYQTFKTVSKYVREFNVLQNLFEINKQIIAFDYEFKSQTNGTELNSKFVEKVLVDFITISVQKILNIIDIRDVSLKRGAIRG